MDFIDEFVRANSHCEKSVCVREMEDAVKGLIRQIAIEVEENFPNPNPLASLYSNYLGDDIVEFIRRLGR